MDKRKQQEEQYGDIFNFLFSAQKEKKNKPVPKYGPKMDTYSSALLDIGSQGAVFPLTSAFGAINKYIGSASEAKLAGGVKAGFGSGVLLDPNKYVNKKVSLLRSINTWASVGGSLHYGIDGALTSLWARNNGISPEIAFKVGHLYQDAIKTELERKADKTDLFGYVTPTEVKNKEKELFESSMDLRLRSIYQGNPQITDALKGEIRRLQKEGSKAQRIRKTAEFLKQNGIDIKQGARMSYLIWGDPSDNNELGLFRISEGTAKSGLKNIFEAYDKNNKYDDKGFQSEFLKDYLDIKNGKNYTTPKSAPTMLNDQKRAYFDILVRKYNFDKKLAHGIALELAKSDLRRNDGADIAQGTASFVLSKNIQDDLIANGQYADLSQLESRVNKILQKKGTSLGMRAARGAALVNWLSMSGLNTDYLLQGSWEKIGSDDLNFTQIVKEEKIFKDGVILGSYYKGADTVMGKILGKFYYLHPNNLIRGLFLDGSLFLKWASKNGQVNTEHIGYLLYNMRFGKILNNLAKPMQLLSNSIMKLLNPFMNAIKNFARKALTTLIGATGLAGLAVNFLMNVIGDKLIYIANQIIIIAVFAIFGILFILFGGLSTSNSNQAVSSALNSNTTQTATANTLGVNTFTDSDMTIPD